MKSIHATAINIYKHPLQVSNAALKIQLEIYKIHRDMKDIVLSQTKEELDRLITEIRIYEEIVYKNLSIIETYIIGDSGLKLKKDMSELFKSWKPIRDEVILLVTENQYSEAIAITKGKGAQHVLKMEDAAQNIYEYASHKAKELKEQFISKSKSLEELILFVDVLFLIMFIFIAYYTTIRLSKYINKNAHINSVLNVIRHINQLIVREKEVEKLLQESCNILTSKHLYGHTWIMIFGDDNQIEYIVGTDTSENFTTFKNKIKEGWKPYCTYKSDDKPYSYIHNIEQTCNECSLKSIYNNKNAFNIELKYENKLYGYLNISVEKKYILDNNELSLLTEVASDIAYAINTLNTVKKLENSEKRYRTLFQGNRSIELIIDPINGKIVECNNKAVEYYGYSYQEMINMSITDINLLSFESIRKEMDLSKSGQRDMFHFKHKLASGEIRDVEVYSGPIEIDNKLLLYSIIFDITDREEANQAIISLKNLYNNIISSVDNLIFVKDINFRYIACNGAFEKFIGRSKEEIIGKSDFDIFDKEVAQFFRDHDEVMLKQQKPVSNFEWVTYPDGSKKYLLTVKSPMFDEKRNIFALVGNSADITEKKEAEMALQISNDKFEKAFNYTPNIIIITNMKTGKIYDINKTFETILGHKKEDVIGKTTFDIDLWHPVKDRTKYINILRKHGVVEGNIYEFNTKEKTQITAKVFASLITIDSNDYILAIAEDITELIKKDEMLISQSRHAAMGEMIGMIAHQWRQPLTTISMSVNNMLLDIAMDNFNAAAAKEYANSISNQTQHLSETIDDFRNFFKADKVLLKVNIKEILDQTFSLVKDSLKNNHIEFKSTYETEKEVNAYPRELIQVFLNIITNAKDVLQLNKSEKPFINIKVYEDTTYINIEICDNGGGIDEDIFPKIFEPYFSTTTEQAGSGLGLYMSKMIIEEHLHGKIEAHNKDDGMCFIVRLLKE